MEQEIRMTEEMIKAITEKFSLATVFVLELPRFAIRDINALDGCMNLLHLNLSQNQITKIKGLQKCINLEWLVLAQNKIMTIEGLAGCAKLKRLEIQENMIEVISAVTPANANRNLTALYLQGNGYGPNPVCAKENYREDVMDNISQLRNLDGRRRGAILADPGDLASYEVDMSGINTTVDSSPWITHKLVSDEPVILGGDVTALIESCQDLLSEGETILRNVK